MIDGVSVEPARAADPLVLAVDVGTSSARALVYDGRGRQVDGWKAQRTYAVQTTVDGGVQIDAEALVRLVAACISDVLHLMRQTSRRVVAVACDTFWHSLLGVGEGACALTPIYTWADTRAGTAARKLRHLVDERSVHARTGAVIHSSYLPAKILWLTETEPNLVGRIQYWMSFGEYLYLQLFGERRISISMASGTGLFDQNTCRWDREILDVLQLQEGKLSPLAEFSDTMRGLAGEYARDWPELNDVPWYLALGDGACNNIGSGGFCNRWAVAMVGTSGALRVVYEAEKADIPWGLWTYRVDSRRFVQGGALSDGGNMFAWLTHTLQVDDIPTLEGELAQMKPDGHGLTVLPFLAGERSPDWNADARAAVVGMTLDTRPVHIVRACLEAVAYRFGIIYDLLTHVVKSVEGTIASGAGLIHSPVWIQIMADVFGAEMSASAVPEATSRGAALLILESMGVITDLGDVPSPLGQTYRPNQEYHRTYRAAMSRQGELYSLLIGQPSGVDARTGAMAPGGDRR